MNKKTPNEALGRPDVVSFSGQVKFPIKVLLDDIRSLSNVGSIFRTCDAFNIDELILCGITGKPPHREIQRTALGATESVNWMHAISAKDEVNRLKKEGYLVIAVEQCSESVHPAKLTLTSANKVAVILGSEVDGVSQALIDLADVAVEIPQLGTKHSLNVTVAAGIVLWELFKRYHPE